MTGKAILVLNGHPAAQSLSRGFAEAYRDAATQAGHECRMWHLSEMAFDPSHDAGGYATNTPLEPVLTAFLTDVDWCAHLVVCTPMWWGGMPAKLKGLFDRSFIPGRAFHAKATTAIGMPKPLLTGKSARVVITADTPGYFQRWVYGNAMQRQFRHSLFGFVGIKPTRFSYFAPASKAPAQRVERWMAALRTHAQAGR